MNKKKLEYYKKLLVEKRKNVLETIEKLKEITMRSHEDWPDHPRYSDHIAEQGSDSLDREQSFLLLSRERQYLQKIDRTLSEIVNGNYGKCKVCGKEISEERLKAVPTTNICFNCKIAQQKRNINTNNLK